MEEAQVTPHPMNCECQRCLNPETHSDCSDTDHTTHSNSGELLAEDYELYVGTEYEHYYDEYFAAADEDNESLYDLWDFAECYAILITPAYFNSYEYFL
jgi:hypothetical protein